MMRLLATAIFLWSLGTASACAVGYEGVKNEGFNFGVLPIGGTPKTMSLFVASDCGSQEPKFSDCSATDANGLTYDFFEGALSKISAKKESAAVSLPAGIEFGDKIESSARAIAKAFKVKLDRSTSPYGHTVYSSDFVMKSSIGTLYSVELLADQHGRLAEVAARTDF